MSETQERESYSVDAIDIVSDNYRDLSKYVASTRAYCSLTDGLKAVYRRTLYASRNYNKLVKSASIVGDGIKYHPHGDGNIYGALVSMTCKYGRFPLYVGKGNFGGLGSSSAAMRYTEARLSELARLMYLELIDYAEFVEGEAGYSEPKYLPALLPYAFLVGSGGIPVGLPGAEIPTVDVMQLIQYYKSKLTGDEAEYPLPDFGNVLIDQDIESARDVIRTGHGKLWFRGSITQEDENIFVVTDTTPKRSISDVLKRLQWYIDNEVVDYTDESTDVPRYVFELVDPSQLSSTQLKNEIDKALKCSVTYKYIFVDEDSNATYCGLDHVVDTSLNYLKECTVRKFTHYADKSNKLLLVLLAIEALKNTDIMSKLATITSQELIDFIVTDLGFDVEIAKEVIKKPISYLTRSHQNEIDDLRDSITNYENYKSNPEQYLITLYEKLEEMVRPVYESKLHSRIGLVTDIVEVASECYATLIDNAVEITEEPINDTSVKWSKYLIAVKEDAEVQLKGIKGSTGTTVELDEQYVAMLSDKDKYLVLISWKGQSITVLKTENLSRSKVQAKLYEGDSVVRAFTTSASTVEFTDEKGKTYEINLESYVKSRVSRAQWISRSQLVSWKEID